MKVFSRILFITMMSFYTHNLTAGILEDVMEGKSSVVDLTYPLNERNAHWPKGAYSLFKFEAIATLNKDKVFSGKYSTPEHLGTHIDAPNHFEQNQPSVDQIPFIQLIGHAIVIDVKDKVEKNTDYTLSASDISSWEKINGQIPDGAIVLLNTGWSCRWSNFNDYKNTDKNGQMHFPGYSRESVGFLVEKRQIKGIGIDTLSGDCGTSSDFQVHHVIGSAGKFILENVANLDKLPPRGSILIIAPIKIEGGSGGQCRIWAILPE